MARKRSSSWLNQLWWKLALADWIALFLGFLGIVLVFCLFFIRRDTLEIRLEHTFGVDDPEFLGSVLAMTSPRPDIGEQDRAAAKRRPILSGDVGGDPNRAANDQLRVVHL